MENKYKDSSLNNNAYRAFSRGENVRNHLSISDLDKDLASLYNISSKESEVKENDDFPIVAFPEKIQQIIHAFHAAYKLPKSYYGLSILTVCGAVIGNAYSLKYKEGYFVPPIIYSAIVGNASVGKTPAIRLCLKPILKIEEAYNQSYKEVLCEWEKEISQLNKGDTQPPKPYRKELIINDATTEAIHYVLSRNPRGLILFQDELLAWINNLNKYSNGSDMEYWLSNWSNVPAKINRATKETLMIPKPCTSVIGGLQPAVLDNLAKNGRKDNGFLVRILFAFPKNLKKPYESDFDLNPNVYQEYENLILGLNNLSNDVVKDENTNEWKIDTIIIHLSDRARCVYKKWNKSNTDKINKTEDDSLKSLYGKLENYCLRFALILELMTVVCNQEEIHPIMCEVNQNTMINAILLTEYFRTTGEKVLNRIENLDPLEGLSSNVQNLYNSLPDYFTTQYGVQLAKTKDISERTFKRLLNKKSLFRKVKRGHYEKV